MQENTKFTTSNAEPDVESIDCATELVVKTSLVDVMYQVKTLFKRMIVVYWTRFNSAINVCMEEREAGRMRVCD